MFADPIDRNRRSYSGQIGYKCPRVNFFARVVVAFFGIAGVLTRSIWLFMAAVNDRKMSSIYSIISWICIGGILAGIIFGYVLKVKDSDAMYL